MGIADKIKTKQDRDGMLRRALERIIQLYTDKSHFVYELLQNAEDACARNIKFIQYLDRLEVFHDGKPFTSSNLEGLCDIGKSDKAYDLNKIGEFGVGFKSVFSICNVVRLYSEPSHYRDKAIDDAVPFAVKIVDFTSLEDIDSDSLPNEYTTKFVFPYAAGLSFSGYKTLYDLQTAISKKLQNLGITTLLFMRHLESIEYQIEIDNEPITGAYLLEKTEINDHCTKVSALGMNGKQSTSSRSDEMVSYLKFSHPVKNLSTRTVDIAFPLKEVEDGSYRFVKARSPYVSVYFPTETESKLNFIVQGPYRTTPNRSSIPMDDDDNKSLVHETEVLLYRSLMELKNMGKLNMSLINLLPLSRETFANFNLFEPLYDVVEGLFSKEEIIPSASGQYVSAEYSKICRLERLATVFTDDLLTELVDDGHQYYWLPTFLTENNREYEDVYRFLTQTLKIPIFRPERLSGFIGANPNFLPRRDDAWLVELYGIFESVPASFAKNGERNLATTNIVKTNTDKFVAPFRREGNSYLPNVFLEVQNTHNESINFVDSILYSKCRSFFDNVIGLQKPNEYEIFVKDIEKRYSERWEIDKSRHIEDIKILLKYLGYGDFHDEVLHIIKEKLVLLCCDGQYRNAYTSRIFLPVNQQGVRINDYFINVVKNVHFIDLEFYQQSHIEKDDLVKLGVKDSLLLGEDITRGIYETGNRGKQPEWYTIGDFRWKLSIEAIKDVLRYISMNPRAKDSIIKSKIIIDLMVLNEKRLCGDVYINSTVVDNKKNEPCELIKILKRETRSDWNGKWLFDKNDKLVSPKEISKDELNHDYYNLKSDSVLFGLLDFKKSTSDEIEEIKQKITSHQLDVLFEAELQERFGLTIDDVKEFHRKRTPIGETPSFPTLSVRSWESLKKHVAEMLLYADPVKFEERLRRIRTTNHPEETRSYLKNMYRYDGDYRSKFACQLCHEPCSSFEAVEIFPDPKVELDPINLCLCPTCAAQYRLYRANETISKKIRQDILAVDDKHIDTVGYVKIDVPDGQELWFTQTHFAEVKELLHLSDQVEKMPEKKASDRVDYSGYTNKVLRRNDGFIGVVKGIRKGIDDYYFIVSVLCGMNAGRETEIKASFVLNGGTYFIVDK